MAKGYSIVAIMLATLVISGMAVVVQVVATRLVTGPIRVYPTITRAAFSEVFAFGFFSWLQALAGCIFSYADRLIIGFMLGASSVAYYSICVQAAQRLSMVHCRRIALLVSSLDGATVWCSSRRK